MKRVLIFYLYVFATPNSFAQTDSVNYSAANTLYENRNYSQAAYMYETLLKNNGPSAEIYYNLGNAYYKNGKMGNAILNYERCLSLEPRNRDAKFNLSLANLRIKDKLQPVDELLITQWWHASLNLFTAKTWSLITIFLCWLSLPGLALYLFSKKIRFRKIGFFAAVICFLLFLFTSITTFSKVSYDNNVMFAIITSPSAIVKSGPSESETNLTILHEGLKLQVLDTDGEWAKVKLANGVIGWVLVNNYTGI
ncbi:MAG: tetratricopeptide repeat protein [Chitinophagales bacterium]